MKPINRSTTAIWREPAFLHQLLLMYKWYFRYLINLANQHLSWSGWLFELKLKIPLHVNVEKRRRYSTVAQVIELQQRPRPSMLPHLEKQDYDGLSSHHNRHVTISLPSNEAWRDWFFHKGLEPWQFSTTDCYTIVTGGISLNFKINQLDDFSTITCTSAE